MSTERIVIRAFVLRATESKEADCILTVLTAERGRLTVIARGARRRNSRYTAACQVFSLSEMVLYERNGWLLLGEAMIIEQFMPLRTDLALLSLASYFAEMTETAAQEETEAGEIMSLLLNSIYALCTVKKDPELVRAAFELRLLSASGYEPLLDDCAVCGERSPVSPVFDAEQGIILCKKCADYQTGVALDDAALAAMRHIVGAPMKRMLSFALNEQSQKRLNNACECFAAAQLDRRFKTLDFYKSIC